MGNNQHFDVKSSGMAFQLARASNGSHASLVQFPVCHFSSPLVFTEANMLKRLIGQIWLYALFPCRIATCHCADMEIDALLSSHLLAGKQLSLVLVDNGVTCSHMAILIPGNWTLEISWVGQTIGSFKVRKVTVTNGLTVPSVCFIPI